MLSTTESPHSIRHEFSQLDPLAAEPVRIVPNVPEASAKPATRSAAARARARMKYVRAPSRDHSRNLVLLVGELADQTLRTVTRVRWVSSTGASQYESIEYTSIDETDPALVALANVVNAKASWVADAWRTFHNGERRNRELVNRKLTPAERRAAEAELEVLRRLQPMRHLIALASHPEKAEEGELDRAVESLGAAAPAELRPVIADIALAIDLAAQLKALSESLNVRLFAVYEQLVDTEPSVRTLVVNWARDHRPVEAIYPPGHCRGEAEVES